MPPSREGHEYNSRTQSRAAAQNANCNSNVSARTLTPKAQYKKAYSKKALGDKTGKLEDYHENDSKWSSKRSHEETSSEEEEEEPVPSKEREAPCKARKKAKHLSSEDAANAHVASKATTQRKREAVAAGGVRKVCAS